jgi:hypothetical protein
MNGALGAFIIHRSAFIIFWEPLMSKPSDDRPQGDPAQQQQRQIEVDDSKTITAYANFCRVTGTPEELIIDFGLNAQPVGMPTEPVAITQRIVTNYYTAKRMLHALQLTLQRHEQAFGVLEVDVQKRLTPGARAAMTPAQGR